MGCYSGFALLGRGAILKQMQDGLPNALVGVSWGLHRGHIHMCVLKAGPDRSQTVSRDAGEGHLGRREQSERKHSGKKTES